MILPVLLILVAMACAAFAGYGTDPRWVNWWSHGLEVICAARRFQVPTYAACMLACAALVLMVATGKRRVWWLIGLAPVLALIAHRLTTSPMRDFRVADNPPTVTAEAVESHGVKDDDWVVGVVIGGVPHAYPYAGLYRTPVVVQQVVESRAVVVWNPFANLARVAVVERAVVGREMEVVSMPANATLVYNARYGEFINGVTLRQPGGGTLTGFGRGLEAESTTFGRWRTRFPGTKVMVSGEVGEIPREPLKPKYGVPGGDGSGARTTVVLLATSRPTALMPEDVSDVPANVTTAGGDKVLVTRDVETRRVRVFSRVLATGEELRFAAVPTWAKEKVKPGTSMFDVVAGEGWRASGFPMEEEGKWKGQRLASIGAWEGAYLEVLKYWMPELEIRRVTSDDLAEISPPEPPAPQPRQRTQTRTRRR